MQGSLQMGLSALASAAVSGLHDGTALPMTGIMAVCALIGASTLNGYRFWLKRSGRSGRITP
jgi:DHA1 family bicyclomycin/chloramphenicol resistance-like MFS transporter